MNLRRISVTTLLVGLLGATGCTGLWLLVQDEEGLPCAPNGDCNAGFVCVEELCRRADAKTVGDACAVDSECNTGICADVYNPEFCGDQLSCLSIGRVDADFRCRAPCDGTLQDVRNVCASGERCVQDTTREVNQLYCQEGVCDVDSDCGTNSDVSPNKQNICTSAVVNVGESGLCSRGCDPLQCDFDTGCTGCPAGSPSCEALDNAAGDRFGCLASGIKRPGESCDFFQNFCVPGAFCSGGQNAVCLQFCNADGGAPACNGQLRCNRILDEIGFCQ